MHAGHALEREVAAEHRQCSGERAHGCTRIAHEKLNRVVVFELTTQARDGDCRALHIHTAAELAQRGQHHPGVVGVEQVVNHRGALAQSREQQHAVGNTFRAG